jgi:hypothetical protein
MILCDEDIGVTTPKAFFGGENITRCAFRGVELGLHNFIAFTAT